MLSQMQRLSLEVDGRYATDEELKFIPEYLKTYELRLQTYQKLQEIEATIVQQVCDKMRVQDPAMFLSGNLDVTPKCKRDILLTWRYSATAVLLDDSEMLRERLLLWLQTLMRAFAHQRACNLTYLVMKDVAKQHLSPQQSALLMPILEMNQSILSV